MSESRTLEGFIRGKNINIGNPNGHRRASKLLDALCGHSSFPSTNAYRRQIKDVQSLCISRNANRLKYHREITSTHQLQS